MVSSSKKEGGTRAKKSRWARKALKEKDDLASNVTWMWVGQKIVKGPVNGILGIDV